MNTLHHLPSLSRRALLQSLSSGFGYMAFAGLASRLAAKQAASAGPLAPKSPHFPARAKRIIFLCMNGGPSHVDTFDYKPELQKNDGKSVANRNRGGLANLLASPWKFSQHGKSGLWISELFPGGFQARRRPVSDPQHEDRPAGAPAGLHADAHRQLPVRASLARRVVALRPGHW